MGMTEAGIDNSILDGSGTLDRLGVMKMPLIIFALNHKHMS